MAPRVAMLLDNHFGPDRRVEYESRLLSAAGLAVRVIAWDRRAANNHLDDFPQRGSECGTAVWRVHVPAPPGGGRKTFSAMLRFGRQVWRHRGQLLSDVDLLIVHDVYLLPLGWFLHRRLGTRFMYDAHEEYAAMEGGRYPPWWLRTIEGLESRLARRAELVIVPGTIRQARWTRAGFSSPLVLRNAGAPPRKPIVGKTTWDLAYTGSLGEARRTDILLEVARRRPDLRIAVAGRGRKAEELEGAARALANFEYLGWLEDSESVLLASRAVYYGLDPAHPYSAKACPNNLYQALHLRRPLIFFCGGEPAEVARRFRIGVRCDPTPDSVIAALDQVGRNQSEWEFAAALEHVTASDSRAQFVEAVVAASTAAASASSR